MNPHHSLFSSALLLRALVAHSFERYSFVRVLHSSGKYFHFRLDSIYIHLGICWEITLAFFSRYRSRSLRSAPCACRLELLRTNRNCGGSGSRARIACAFSPGDSSATAKAKRAEVSVAASGTVVHLECRGRNPVHADRPLACAPRRLRATSRLLCHQRCAAHLLLRVQIYTYAHCIVTEYFIRSKVKN